MRSLIVFSLIWLSILPFHLKIRRQCFCSALLLVHSIATWTSLCFISLLTLFITWGTNHFGKICFSQNTFQIYFIYFPSISILENMSMHNKLNFQIFLFLNFLEQKNVLSYIYRCWVIFYKVKIWLPHHFFLTEDLKTAV